MLETLITSKTRIKLLLKFFLNANSCSYLRELETEFHESTNGIRMELNRFENAGLLVSTFKGNKKIYRANTDHPLFPDINNLLLKYIGFDKIIENIINKLGDIKSVYVVGGFAKGIDNHVIDLIFVCEIIERVYLASLIEKVEKLIKRKIRYLIFKQKEFEIYATSLTADEVLLLWSQ